MNVQSQGLFNRTNDTVCEEQATGSRFEGVPVNVEEFKNSIVEDLVSHGDQAYECNNHPNNNIWSLVYSYTWKLPKHMWMFFLLNELCFFLKTHMVDVI